MRDGITVESSLNDENLLRNNSNKEDNNFIALHVYAVINKKKGYGSPVYFNVTAVEKNDDEMTVQSLGSNYVNIK